MFNKKSSFTLAEILITVTIIGIIAVITLPRMVGNINVQAARTKFRNTYVQLQNGLKIAENRDKIRFDELTKIEHENASDNEKNCMDDFVRRYFNGTPVTRDDVNSSNNFKLGTINVLNPTEQHLVHLTKIERIYKLPNGVQLLVPNVVISRISMSTGGSFPCPGDGSSAESSNANAYYCILYIDINGRRGPNNNLGYVTKGMGNSSPTQDTEACLNVEDSSYFYGISYLDNYCRVPDNVYFDIFPIIFSSVDHGIFPANNAVMTVLNNRKNGD